MYCSVRTIVLYVRWVSNMMMWMNESEVSESTIKYLRAAGSVTFFLRRLYFCNDVEWMDRTHEWKKIVSDKSHMLECSGMPWCCVCVKRDNMMWHVVHLFILISSSNFDNYYYYIHSYIRLYSTNHHHARITARQAERTLLQDNPI